MKVETSADKKMWNASRFCVPSLRRGHANLLCIVPILVYVLPKQVHQGEQKILSTKDFQSISWCWDGVERIFCANLCAKSHICRPVVPGCAMAHPICGRSVNPISTRGTDYAHLITTGPPRFSDLPTALDFAGWKWPNIGDITLWLLLFFSINYGFCQK